MPNVTRSLESITRKYHALVNELYALRAIPMKSVRPVALRPILVDRIAELTRQVIAAEDELRAEWKAANPAHPEQAVNPTREKPILAIE